MEVDADGYPGREADPGDGRPVGEAEDQADAAYRRWAQEGERGNPPASPALDREIDRAAAQWPEYSGQDPTGHSQRGEARP